jgi:hypothetical protein
MEVLNIAGGGINTARSFIMKINKKNVVGIAVLLVLFGFLLAGCISFGTPITFEETETSKEIFNAISESIPSNIVTSNPANPRVAPSSRLVLDQRTTAGEIVSLLINKFPGLTELFISPGGIRVSYQGKEYNISCEFESTGGVISVVGRNSIVLSISSVRERIEPEPQSEEL